MEAHNLDLALALRHQLHQYPQLSYRERETAQRLLAFLRANTKRLEIVDCGRWLYAAYHAGADRPSIAFRADFDAVPVPETCDIPWKSTVEGVAHKCGHDGHSAALAAFALEIDQKGADKNIYFLFQHAEETGQGAAECRSLITRQSIDEIYGYHNMSGFTPFAVCTRAGILNCASRGMSLFFQGRPAHAGEPEAGLSPLPAVIQLALGVPGIIEKNTWQDTVMSTTVHLQVGEAAFGVAPGDGVVRLTLRAVYESDLDALARLIEDYGRALAGQHGLEMRIEICDSFPETRNHRVCTQKIQAAARALGMAVEECETIRASEDFGHYTKLIPGAMFWMGNPSPVALHTPEYDFPDEHIPRVVALYGEIAKMPVIK